MSLAAEKFTKFLDEKGLRYEYFERKEGRNEAVRIGYKAENAESISVMFFFDDNERSINVKSFSIVKVPADKLLDIYVLLNGLNCEYRWVKFYVDDDNEVTVSGDAIIDLNSVGEECFEMMLRYIHIIDEVYPRLMKTIWS